MRELFELMERTEEMEGRKVLTVLGGEHFGEKAFFVGEELLWTSSGESFFSSRREQLLAVRESGEIMIDDTPVFCDYLGQEKKLVICGGGHVAIPSAEIGRMLGFHVTVLEDRPKFADNARRAGASRVICEDFEKGLDQIEGDGDTYFVIVTRGHRHDEVCLEKIVKKEHAYIGMIGSRRRVAIVKENLLDKGCGREVLEQVYTPIGLKIGAESPAEIAVAIMGEIIEVKNTKKRTWGYSGKIRRKALDLAEGERLVLATIVRRKGSAPQGIGAKMLIARDGSCIGTIGGGCMEAEVIRKALVMAGQSEEKIRLCTVDMTGTDAEDEGMVCGGTVEILLEVLE